MEEVEGPGLEGVSVVQDPGLEGVEEEADPGPELGGVEDAAPLQVYRSKRKTEVWRL